MLKKNRPPTEPEIEICAANSENVIENNKYIKKLALQRLVLKKIVQSDLNLISTTTSKDPDCLDSSKLITKKKPK